MFLFILLELSLPSGHLFSIQLYVLFLYSSSTAFFVVSRYFLVYHFRSFVDFWTIFGFSDWF